MNAGLSAGVLLIVCSSLSAQAIPAKAQSEGRSASPQPKSDTPLKIDPPKRGEYQAACGTIRSQKQLLGIDLHDVYDDALEPGEVRHEQRESQYILRPVLPEDAR